jgi:hemolysin III
MNGTSLSLLGFSEPFSSWSHFVAALFFASQSFFLFHRGRGNPLRITALAIYFVTIIFLLSMSGTYHLLPFGTTGRDVLQRLDHAGIWMLIIGSFTPIHVILFDGFWRWGVLLIIWTIGVTGMILEVIFFKDFPEYLSLIFYLSLGWVGVISSFRYIKQHSTLNIQYMLYGGLCYSVGAIFDFIRWPVIIPWVFGPHEVFHLFIIGGIYFHWKFIHHIADMGIVRKLTVVIKRREQGPDFAKAKHENIHFFFEQQKNFIINCILQSVRSIVLTATLMPCVSKIKKNSLSIRVLPIPLRSLQIYFMEQLNNSEY